MPTLELINGVTGKPTGDTMTLKNGKLEFEGERTRNIAESLLGAVPAETIFKNLTNWSNGYAYLRLKKE